MARNTTPMLMTLHECVLHAPSVIAALKNLVERVGKQLPADMEQLESLFGIMFLATW